MHRQSCYALFPCLPQRGFEICMARESDRHAISEVAAEAFEETYDVPYQSRRKDYLFAQFGQKQAIYLVAKVRGEVVGFAKVVIETDDENEKSAFLDKMYFLKEYCGRGFGTQLLTRCKEEAVAHGANRMYLHCWVANLPAMTFYQKNGFSPMPIMPIVVIDGEEMSGAHNITMTCEGLKASLQQKASYKMH